MSDRIWVITGGTKGIGAGIAARALAEGERVAVLARKPASMPAGEHDDASFLAVAADVCDPGSLAEAMARVEDAFGRVDVLVNNAGVHRGGRVNRIERSDWQQVLDTNLSGPFDTIRAALPLMTSGSTVINIGAVVGLRGFPGDAAYASAKAGLLGLTHALAIELAREGITVNAVLPGVTETEMVAALSDRAREAIVTRVPLGRPATVEEIAHVVWMVSGATYMTGSVIAVDGGLMAALGSAG